MTRKITFSVGEYYHVYNRGTERKIIFTDEYDYQRFTFLLYLCNSADPVDLGDILRQGLALSEIYKISREEKLVGIGAWVLMPNHFHLLLKEFREGGITMFMQKLLTSYSMYYNKKNKRTGHLFEGPFKAKHLNEDKYLRYIFDYIHLNPISIIDIGWKDKKIHDTGRARNFINVYKYSSYLDYKDNIRPERKILDRSLFPDYFLRDNEFDSSLDFWIKFGENI